MGHAVFMLWFGQKGFISGRGPLGKDRTVNWRQEFRKCEVPELWQPRLRILVLSSGESCLTCLSLAVRSSSAGLLGRAFVAVMQLGKNKCSFESA